MVDNEGYFYGAIPTQYYYSFLSVGTVLLRSASGMTFLISLFLLLWGSMTRTLQLSKFATRQVQRWIVHRPSRFARSILDAIHRRYLESSGNSYYLLLYGLACIPHLFIKGGFEIFATVIWEVCSHNLEIVTLVTDIYR